MWAQDVQYCLTKIVHATYCLGRLIFLAVVADLVQAHDKLHQTNIKECGKRVPSVFGKQQDEGEEWGRWVKYGKTGDPETKILSTDLFDLLLHVRRGIVVVVIRKVSKGCYDLFDMIGNDVGLRKTAVAEVLDHASHWKRNDVVNGKGGVKMNPLIKETGEGVPRSVVGFFSGMDCVCWRDDASKFVDVVNLVDDVSIMLQHCEDNVINAVGHPCLVCSVL